MFEFISSSKLKSITSTKWVFVQDTEFFPILPVSFLEKATLGDQFCHCLVDTTLLPLLSYPLLYNVECGRDGRTVLKNLKLINALLSAVSIAEGFPF
jgi:hypothetical protein